MSGDERVVLALRGVRERRQAFELPVGMEAVATTRENLMRVSLMAYVPDEFVVGRVEDIMQGYRQFDSA